eukprot:8730636-Pyramimonas_sp.AAC.1
MWTCEANSDSPAYRMSSHLVSRAVAESDAYPCFWLRGLLPSPWVDVPPPIEHPEWTPIGLSDDDWSFGQGSVQAPLMLFGDASGGCDSMVPRLRRVGVAVCRMQPDAVDIECGLFGPLPGQSQTVHRGELQALVLGARYSTGATVFVTDNLAVCEGWWARLDLAPHQSSTESDLWQELQQIFLTRPRSEFTVEH